MARAGLDKETIIRKAADLANEAGFERITLKLLAASLMAHQRRSTITLKGLTTYRGNSCFMDGGSSMKK